MTTYLRYTLLLLQFVLLASCQTDYASLPTYNPNKQLHAVIEVPAGSAVKMHYNQQTKAFEVDKLAGQDRIIDFLPYPANFGFIPSTETNAQKKPLEIVVIAGSVEAGTIMEVIPVGVLQLETDGELDHKIVAVPARPSERSINASDYNSFSRDYPAAKAILQQWFVYHNPTAKSRFIGWRNEQFAEQEILRWMKL
ncbi:inorganic diphosphatase [Pontibacter sp. JH31]|uniref:inorganic diphosphatase n=1 Tax=Pontibacter aquaedesilientis TaxID=2766980 RepID=A0ABR7XJC9_9BACT|nr:inorganic diphosphatase [Pontibacter aquaedesilientis]MBD1398399.1 inorganic diphosphatase [Pontibacter aquaedesilientis]